MLGTSVGEHAVGTRHGQHTTSHEAEAEKHPRGTQPVWAPEMTADCPRQVPSVRLSGEAGRQEEKEAGDRPN